MGARTKARKRAIDLLYGADLREISLNAAIAMEADRATKEPFERSEAVTERLLAACLDNGLIVYPASRGVDGIKGDAVLFGPPLTISDSEVDAVVERFTDAITRNLRL